MKLTSRSQEEMYESSIVVEGNRTCVPAQKQSLLCTSTDSGLQPNVGWAYQIMLSTDIQQQAMLTSAGVGDCCARPVSHQSA